MLIRNGLTQWHQNGSCFWEKEPESMQWLITPNVTNKFDAISQWTHIVRDKKSSEIVPMFCLQIRDLNSFVVAILNTQLVLWILPSHTNTVTDNQDSKDAFFTKCNHLAILHCFRISSGIYHVQPRNSDVKSLKSSFFKFDNLTTSFTIVQMLLKCSVETIPLVTFTIHFEKAQSEFNWFFSKTSKFFKIYTFQCWTAISESAEILAKFGVLFHITLADNMQDTQLAKIKWAGCRSFNHIAQNRPT